MPLTNEQKQAAQYILDHAHGLRAMLELADSVKSVADLENVAQEAKNRLDAAEKSLTNVKKRIEKAKGDEEAAEAKVAEALNAADKARAGIGEANVRANAILSEASDKGNAIIEDAKARAAKLVKAATDGLDAEIEARNVKLVQLTSSEEELSAVVADLEKRADAARKYLAKLTKES